MAKAFDSKTCKIIIATPNSETAALLHKTLTATGATRKLGRAPPGVQEREIARALTRSGAQ